MTQPDTTLLQQFIQPGAEVVIQPGGTVVLLSQGHQGPTRTEILRLPSGVSEAERLAVVTVMLEALHELFGVQYRSEATSYDVSVVQVENPSDDGKILLTGGVPVRSRPDTPPVAEQPPVEETPAAVDEPPLVAEPEPVMTLAEACNHAGIPAPWVYKLPWGGQRAEWNTETWNASIEFKSGVSTSEVATHLLKLLSASS